MEAFAINENEAILLITTGGLLLIQVLYYACLYLRIPRHQKAIEERKISFSKEYPPLSVVIYAREQREYLEQNLPAVLEQDYPTFEVIVITDGADDGTEDYLTQLKHRYSNLYHSFVPESSRYISHKKLGITLGIKASRYDWIVVTEPDCCPRSSQWLRLLARNFTPHTEVVLGYSCFGQTKSWLNQRAAYDNLFLSMRYLGFALGGKPYMGIGRNLAYNKKLFYKSKGFSDHLNLLRGDDDLFVNRVTTHDNTRVETDANATLHRASFTRAKSWREEKIGYASTARLYRGMQRYAAGFETWSRILFYAAWITMAVIGYLQHHWTIVGIAFIAFFTRYALQIYTMNKNAKALGDSHRYYLLLPVFDFLQPMQSLRWKCYCLLRKKSEFMRK